MNLLGLLGHILQKDIVWSDGVLYDLLGSTICLSVFMIFDEGKQGKPKHSAFVQVVFALIVFCSFDLVIEIP